MTTSANHSALRIGHNALFTLTLTNTGSQAIELPQSNTSATFTLMQGSNTVCELPRPVTLRPCNRWPLARASRFTAIGRARGNHSRPQPIKPGVYQLIASVGEFSAATTVRLEH